MGKSEKHDEEEYIQAVEENQPAGTEEIAESVGVARQSAVYRLDKLEEEDKVSRKKIGSTLVWTID